MDILGNNLRLIGALYAARCGGYALGYRQGMQGYVSPWPINIHAEHLACPLCSPMVAAKDSPERRTRVH